MPRRPAPPPIDPKVAALNPNWLICHFTRRHDLLPEAGRKYYVREYIEGGTEDLTHYVLTCTRCGIERHDICNRQTDALRRRHYENAPDGYYGERGEGAMSHDDMARAYYRRVPEPVEDEPAAVQRPRRGGTGRSSTGPSTAARTTSGRKTQRASR